MWDIYIAVAIMSALSGALFWAGVRISRTRSAAVAGIMCGGAVLCLVLFVKYVHGELILARLMPLSNVIVLGNWLPPGAAFLAGLAWGQKALKRRRRAVATVPLLVVCAWALLGGVVGRPPKLEESWFQGVCLQQDRSSCGAACAVTLLRYLGFKTGINEMAELCLTRSGGTPLLGVYRGLKIKTRGTLWRVEVVNTDIAGLRSDLSSPVILPVRLERTKGVDPRYKQEWGWMPGVRHVVIVYRTEGPEAVAVAEPAFGCERWGHDDLRVLWRGEGIRLVKRDGQQD